MIMNENLDLEVSKYNISIEQAISKGILREIGKDLYEISYRDSVFRFERQLNGWKISTPQNSDVLRIPKEMYLSDVLIELNIIF